MSGSRRRGCLNRCAACASISNGSSSSSASGSKRSLTTHQCITSDYTKHREFRPGVLAASELGIVLSSAEPARVTDRVVPRLTSGHSRCNLPRTFGVRSDWLDAVAEDIRINNRRRNDLLFTTEVGTPIPSATPSAHALAPRGQSKRVDFAVRIHDLRLAHASSLLAGVRPEEPRRPRQDDPPHEETRRSTR